MLGSIYEGINLITGKEVAVKVEPRDCPKQLLNMEVTVMKHLNGKTSSIVDTVIINIRIAGDLSDVHTFSKWFHDRPNPTIILCNS